MSSQLFVGTPSVVSKIADELHLRDADIYNGRFSHNQPFLSFIFYLLNGPEGRVKDKNIKRKPLLLSLLGQLTAMTPPPAGSITARITSSLEQRESVIKAAAHRLQTAVRALDTGETVTDASGEQMPAWAINEVLSTLGNNPTAFIFYHLIYLC